MNVRSLAKAGLLAAVSKLTGRHAVLLPREAADEGSILRLSAPYRVDGERLRVRLLEDGSGKLRVVLLGYEGHFPTKTLLDATARYHRASELTFDLRTGEIRLGDTVLGRVPVPLPGRRFSLRFELDADGRTKRRLTGHYLAANGNGNGAYFEGDNYVDYEAEAASDVPQVLELFEKHGARGPLLEIGCATGQVLGALAQRGIECSGVDVSPWAVEKARERLGSGRVHLLDAEHSSLPPEIASKAPFGTLLVWTVLEHFRDPFQALRKLTNELTSEGSVLLLQTTNARSLTHLLFAEEWEGYFDASHHGVDVVSVETLKRELPRMGWQIRDLATHLSWDGSADPTRAALREWWAADARFRRLLTELDRGDLVTLVAVRE
jgi:2-polyprenyl-3-methyl-5-hydroxy-6-metoxy-1,4-benzoquinol methylase